jgi:hypothetical protein
MKSEESMALIVRTQWGRRWRPDKGFPLEGFSLDKCRYARIDPLGEPSRVTNI